MKSPAPPWALWARLLRSRALLTVRTLHGPEWENLDLRSEPKLIRLNPRSLARFRTLTSSKLRDNRLPPSFLQHLATPLHLELLGDPRVPFSPFGMIHVENEIIERSPFSSWETAVIVQARLFSGGKHPKGRWVLIETSAWPISSPPSAARPAPWSSRITALIPSSRVATAPGTQKNQGVLSPAAAGAPRIIHWELPADLGRQFSFTVGDLNPIHLWPWSARIFGYEKPIIHGMWSLARAIADLESELPPMPCEIRIRFQKPIFIPGSVQLRAWRDNESGIQFHLSSEGSHSTAASGSIRTLIP